MPDCTYLRRSCSILMIFFAVAFTGNAEVFTGDLSESVEQAKEYLKLKNDKAGLHWNQQEYKQLIKTDARQDELPKSVNVVDTLKDSIVQIMLFSSTDEYQNCLGICSGWIGRTTDNKNRIFTVGHLFEKRPLKRGEYAVVIMNTAGKFSLADECIYYDLDDDLAILNTAVSIGEPLLFASAAPKPLERVYTGGLFWQLPFTIRSGEVVSMHTFRKSDNTRSFYTSILSGKGTSGSPVINGSGRVTGYISEVRPSLRPTGMYRGDYFAESVLAECRVLQ